MIKFLDLDQNSFDTDLKIKLCSKRIHIPICKISRSFIYENLNWKSHYKQNFNNNNHR